MPYTFVTRGGLRTLLAGRLGDSSQVFWTATELNLWITEALRTFGLCSGFWRERGTFSTVAGTAFYDIADELTSASAETILAPSVTDRDIIQQLQYALLEPATTQTSWTGTEQFTYSDIVAAIQNRLNQFLADTGIVVSRTTVAVASPTNGLQTLDQSVIDIRRAAWLGASPLDYYQTIWREDERSLTMADQTWNTTSGIPSSYSVMSPPPLTVQLTPLPATGTLELLVVASSAALNPSLSATVLGIPDDLTPAIKWGALADLLGEDGIARDVARAQFAEQRYQQYVALARMLPVVMNAQISDTLTLPVTLQELDSGDPLWQNQQGAPTEIALAGQNLVAFSNVPDDAYTITLDVVRKTPVPTADGDNIQIGREQVDAVLDYAEHIAMFKVAGAEFAATQRQANNFLVQSVTYNQRIAAAARYIFSAADQSQKEKQETQRRVDGPVRGTGSLVVNRG